MDWVKKVKKMIMKMKEECNHSRRQILVQINKRIRVVIAHAIRYSNSSHRILKVFLVNTLF